MNTIVIRNGGNAAAGSTSVLTISVVGLTFTVPNLAAGAGATFNWAACGVGTYVAIVDRTNLVAESLETNNTASRPNSSCP
jgi:subtilase family serine protease